MTIEESMRRLLEEEGFPPDVIDETITDLLAAVEAAAYLPGWKDGVVRAAKCEFIIAHAAKKQSMTPNRAGASDGD